MAGTFRCISWKFTAERLNWKDNFKGFCAAFIMDRILGQFCYTIYKISVALLVLIMWNTLKMVTGMTQTCRC
jgi:hypothetical protein